MYKNLDVCDFQNEFCAYGRGDSFSFKGYKELFNYLENNYPDEELDVIAIDSDFVELTPQEYFNNYMKHQGEDIGDYCYSGKIQMDWVKKYAEKKTTVINVDSSTFIIANNY